MDVNVAGAAFGGSLDPRTKQLQFVGAITLQQGAKFNGLVTVTLDEFNAQYTSCNAHTQIHTHIYVCASYLTPCDCCGCLILYAVIVTPVQYQNSSTQAPATLLGVRTNTLTNTLYGIAARPAGTGTSATICRVNITNPNNGTCDYVVSTPINTDYVVGNMAITDDGQMYVIVHDDTGAGTRALLVIDLASGVTRASYTPTTPHFIWCSLTTLLFVLSAFNPSINNRRFVHRLPSMWSRSCITP